jgi:hypothetical protein
VSPPTLVPERGGTHSFAGTGWGEMGRENRHCGTRTPCSLILEESEKFYIFLEKRFFSQP